MVTSGSAEFDKLRDHLAKSASVRKEVENAFAFLLARANPSDRAARFVVGGTVEWIIAAAAWSAGVLTNPAGHNANGFDLKDLMQEARGLWSVKFSSRARPGPFRITNGLGGAGQGLTEPTLFVHKRLGGMVLIDPALHPQVSAMVEAKPDATILAFKVVEDFAKAHPECVAKVDVPLNEGLATSDPYQFVKDLLAPGQFPNLAKVFQAATPLPATVATEMQQIIAMHAAGTISDAERDQALAKVLGK